MSAPFSFVFENVENQHRIEKRKSKKEKYTQCMYAYIYRMYRNSMKPTHAIRESQTESITFKN